MFLNTINFSTIFTYLLVFYVALFLIFLLLSDSVIYQPPKVPYSDSEQIIKIKTSNNKHISAIYLPNKNAKFTLLISHGNGENLATILWFLQEAHKQNFSVLAYDYQGYGTSEGKSSEKNTYLDILAAYNYLTKIKKTPTSQIIIFGRSLGSGPSIYLASNYPVGGLILQSAFISGFRTLTQIPIFPFDKYNNIKRIPKVKIPILFIHGTKDTIIPFWHSKALQKKASTLTYNLWVDDANHNDLQLIAGNSYWNSIQNYVTKL